VATPKNSAKYLSASQTLPVSPKLSITRPLNKIEEGGEMKGDVISDTAHSYQLGYAKGREDTLKETDEPILEGSADKIKLFYLEKQIDKLAKLLMEKYPEQITEGSAIDVAIKILKENL
jgi:hypothetical protein